MGHEGLSSQYRAHEIPSGNLNGIRHSCLSKAALNTDQRIIQLALRHVCILSHEELIAPELWCSLNLHSFQQMFIFVSI